MKDASVGEIHRHRGHACQCEIETEGGQVGMDAKHGRFVEVKKPAALGRKKALVCK